jgi:hypothetical protein
MMMNWYKVILSIKNYMGQLQRLSMEKMRKILRLG